MHILERASSNTLSAADGGILPEISHKNHHHDDHSMHEETSPSSYESHSDSDVDSDAGDDTEGFEAAHDQEHRNAQPRPNIDTQLPAYKTSKHASPLSPTSRAWYEFDLAVVAALVSPIGNWLTGGDHIKNLLLVVLLIFYLHQIIESAFLSFSALVPALQCCVSCCMNLFRSTMALVSVSTPPQDPSPPPTIVSKRHVPGPRCFRAPST